MQTPVDAAAVAEACSAAVASGSQAGQLAVPSSSSLASHLQLHLSTVTALLAVAWALILHAAQSVAACLASGARTHTAAAKAHLVLLKRASPSRFYRSQQAAAAAVKALSPPPPAPAPPAPHQQLCATATRRRPHAANKQPAQEAAAAVACIQRAGMAAGEARIPMQVQEQRGRLTIALDLDETLLCTYRIELCAGADGGVTALQLVPANRAPGSSSLSSRTASNSSSNNNASSGGGSSSPSWCSSLLSRASSSSSSSSSGALGSYSISTRCAGLPGDLGAAARASAWMHYTPPAAPHLSRTSSGSSSGGGSLAATHPQPQQHPVSSSHQQPCEPHTLAVFLRPGCYEFLAQLSSFAEVVLFTAASRQYGAPLAQLLDPQGRLFAGRLYGDACVNHAGRRGVKDLQVRCLCACVLSIKH